MKRIIVIMALLLIMLTGCSKSQYEVNDQQLGIVLLLDIKQDYYRINIEYSISETALGSITAGNADGSIYKEDDIFFLIDRECFPEGMINLKNFSFHVMTCLDSDSSINESCLFSNECESFEAELGKIYIFTIRETSDGTLELIRE